MLRNLLKLSLRTLNRQRGYFFINAFGLSVGIACSLIITLFILHELSFDQFLEKKDRIFRVDINGIIAERNVDYALTSAIVGPTMLNEFPEVEEYTRISSPDAPTIQYQDKKYIENGFVEADSSFFRIFVLPLIRGNMNTVLKEPFTVVLTRSTALRIFGNEDPVDKMLKVGRDGAYYRVTGIMEDLPENFHLTANMIGSLVSNPDSKDTWWGNSKYATYILLKEKVKSEHVNAKMPGFIRKYMVDLAQQALGMSIDELLLKYKYDMYLLPVGHIHFKTGTVQLANTRQASNPKYLYIFGSVAILIIIIAAINFMNLATAQSSMRSKEVGIKKISGSTRGLLVRQFLSESLILSIASLIIGVVIVENTLPYFNNLLGVNLRLDLFGNYLTIPGLICLSIVIGLLSGVYPAFFLSSFNPYLILKGKLNSKTGKVSLRSILVVIQFSISIILVTGTLIIFRQLSFMLNTDLGFNKEQLMVITRADAVGNHVKAFKEALVRIPEVVRVTSSTTVPGYSGSGRTYQIEGRPGDLMEFRINYIDHDFFDTYEIKLDTGRAFNASFPSDKYASIINESTIRQFNLKDPLSIKLLSNYEKLQIIGVAKDFHFESLHSEISPYIFRMKDDSTNYGYFSIRLSAHANQSTIKEIERVWNEFCTNDPFQFYFMDQDLSRRYQEERQSAQLSLVFSLMAIIVAALGLFGLTSFTIAQRTKEIGIRKTLGSSVRNIIYLITREFVLLIIISTAISWPLIYYIAENWLRNYHYRIDLRLIDFLPGFIIALIIALTTISYRAIRSANTNPVEALRYE